MDLLSLIELSSIKHVKCLKELTRNLKIVCDLNSSFRRDNRNVKFWKWCFPTLANCSTQLKTLLLVTVFYGYFVQLRCESVTSMLFAFRVYFLCCSRSLFRISEQNRIKIKIKHLKNNNWNTQAHGDHRFNTLTIN